MEGVSYGQHNQTTNVHCGRVTASRRPCHIDPRYLDPRYCLHVHWGLPEAKELIALHKPPARGFQVVSSPTARQPSAIAGRTGGTHCAGGGAALGSRRAQDIGQLGS